jgi:hypothetical protein
MKRFIVITVLLLVSAWLYKGKGVTEWQLKRNLK